MTLDECRANIGKGVVYTPGHGAPEDGVITDVRSVYVMVRYRGDGHSKATHPARLSLLAVAE